MTGCSTQKKSLKLTPNRSFVQVLFNATLLALGLYLLFNFVRVVVKDVNDKLGETTSRAFKAFLCV
jgi:hypothetical protein